ncbi:Uncharacterised protein [Mycobacteroides abscessus subsp. massiliense]|nr:Uncharacterised protein [Mycobacteroides abscessus subsp. massiliense]
MWLCSPTSRKLSVAKTRRTASSACPPARDNPNFWSSCAVEMNSWVCASTGTARDRVQSLDLDHRIDDDVSDAYLHRLGELRLRFVITVQRDSPRRELGAQRDGQLAR